MTNCVPVIIFVLVRKLLDWLDCRGLETIVVAELKDSCCAWCCYEQGRQDTDKGDGKVERWVVGVSNTIDFSLSFLKYDGR